MHFGGCTACVHSSVRGALRCAVCSCERVRTRACARRYTEAGRELTFLPCGHRNQLDRLIAAGGCLDLDQRFSAGQPFSEYAVIAAFEKEPGLAISCQ